jgi:sucrose-6-phosphate hydrolase SacC (GH32 family)
MRFVLAVAVLLGTLISVPASAAAPPAGSISRYTMTAFTNSSESNMYVYDSNDATGYRLLRGPAYTPPSGLIRDPSIMKHTDGYYWIVYTTNWNGNTIGFARSTDRLNWTFVRNVTIGLSNISQTWAPEWFKDTDGSVNIVFSLQFGNTGGFRPYRITATNGALSSFSGPTVLSGIQPNYIDTFVVKQGSTYHAFTKNETTKYIEYATASSLTGPYTFRRTGNWAGWGGPNEGQSLVQLDNGGWRIYFDAYTSGAYYYSDSYDGFNTWTARTSLPGLSGFARHFTVLKETVAGGVTLPTNTRRSWRSANATDRSIRHRDNLGYVDPVSAASDATTRQDATFTVVPGLADANCYSFQGVNVSGYLRHYDKRIRLDANDGSAVFRSDATFCAKPGLSGGGTVSLESYNYPGSYVRHYNYELRIDPFADNATYRADASYTSINPWAA